MRCLECGEVYDGWHPVTHKCPGVILTEIKKSESACVFYHCATDGWECGLCSYFVPWGMFHPCFNKSLTQPDI